MLRYSLENYYKKISDLYRDRNINNIKLIINEIKNEPIQQQILIIRSIKHYLIRDVYLASRYNKILKRLEKEHSISLENRSWKQITNMYSYYIKYNRNQQFYYRNIALFSLFILLPTRLNSCDILKLKLTRDINNNTPYTLKVINNEKSYINLAPGTELIELSEQLHLILIKFLVDSEIEEDELLFKFVQNRITSLLITHLNANASQIKNAYLNNNFVDEEDDDNCLIVRIY